MTNFARLLALMCWMSLLAVPLMSQDPCSNITSVAMDTPISVTLSGPGVWNPAPNCGQTSPGQEKIYKFTTTYPGVYTINIESTDENAIFNYFYKEGGCNSSNWICLGTAWVSDNFNTGLLFGQEMYYILVVSDDVSSGEQTFKIVSPPPPPDPCLNIQTLTCGTPVSVSLKYPGGAWQNEISCDLWYNYSGGEERVYSFTPTQSGEYYIGTEELLNGGDGSAMSWVTFSLKAASDGCNQNGWLDGCLQWIVFAGDIVDMGWLTAGNEYYILIEALPNMDPNWSEEVSSSIKFSISCPPPIPPCLDAPVAPDNYNIYCLPGPLTLSWPAAPGATSYEVYFGTSPNPPLYSTGESTSVTVGSLEAGTYYWQVRPANAQGTAGNCPVWSFLVQPDPEGNVFANPIVIGSLPYSTSGNTLAYNCWTSEFGNPSPDVFYRFTINTCESLVDISLDQTTFPNSLSLLNSDGIKIADDDNLGLADASILMNVPAGTYYIVVEGAEWYPYAGNYHLNVSVSDGTPPTISCPPDKTVAADISCQAVLDDYTSLGTATDNCTANPAKSQTPAPGEIFGLGTTLVTLKATDGAGLTGTCSFNVTVADQTPPVAICPADFTVDSDPAECGAVLSSIVLYSDNCNYSHPITVEFEFPIGTSPVYFYAYDPSGNSDTCTFNVTVNDVTLPTITCPANIVDNNAPGACGAVESYETPTATDNCEIDPPELLSGLPSGSIFPVGITTNVWQAKDPSNNSATCSFTVSISDIQAPTVICPPNITKPNDFGQCGRTIGYLGNAFGNDNCFIDPLTNDSPGFFPLGATTVTYKVTDGAGNTGTCSMTVTIYDNEYPTVVCPPNITTQTDELDCAATVGYSATAHDNCSGVTLKYTNDPNSSFELGYTNVTATATDAAGNSVNCSFLIKVDPRVEICNDYDDDCDGYVDEAQDWKKVAKRIAKNGGAFDEYGISVDIDDEWAIVGSNKKNSNGQPVGSAYLLHRVNGEWTGVLRLQPDQLSAGIQFGSSVAIHKDIAAVGAPSDDEMSGNAGAVFIYQQNAVNPNSWVQTKKLFASDSGEGNNFGAAVALDGNWLVAGSPLHNGIHGADAGAAYVFGRNTGATDNWGQAAQLIASDGEANDNFGQSVAIDGENVVIGAPGDDDQGAESGAAYRFNRNQGGADSWGQVAKLHGAQTLAGDKFGSSVAISGGFTLVGAPYNDLTGDDAGAAFAFNPHGQMTLLTNPYSHPGDHYGAAVAIDGEYAVVSAPGDNPFGDNSGKAFVYLLIDQGFALVGQLTDGGGAAGDALGTSAAISNRTVLLGAPFDQYGNAAHWGSVVFFEGLCSDDSAQPHLGDEPEVTLAGLDVRVFPVPFSETLTIQVNTDAAKVQISILNTLGQEVARLNEGQTNGQGRYEWQAGNIQPGMYFVRVQAGQLVQTKPVILVRD